MDDLPGRLLKIEAAINEADLNGRHRIALALNQEWIEAAIMEFCARAVPPVETAKCMVLHELLSTIEGALDDRAGTDTETAQLQAAHVLAIGLLDYNLRHERARQAEDASDGIAALVRAGEILGRLRGWAVPVLTGILDRAAESERVLYLQTFDAPLKAAATKTRWVTPAIFGFEAYEFLKHAGEHNAEDEAYGFAESEGFKVPSKRTTLSLHLKSDAYGETVQRAKKAISEASSHAFAPPDGDGALAFRALAYMRARLLTARRRSSSEIRYLS
jgi:hypothetical protein